MIRLRYIISCQICIFFKAEVVNNSSRRFESCFEIFPNRNKFIVKELISPQTFTLIRVGLCHQIFVVEAEGRGLFSLFPRVRSQYSCTCQSKVFKS